MSKLDAFRTERRRAEAYHEKPRLGMVAIIVLIVLALAAGLAEIDLLPRYGADEFSSILFGAG